MVISDVHCLQCLIQVGSLSLFSCNHRPPTMSQDSTFKLKVVGDDGCRHTVVNMHNKSTFLAGDICICICICICCRSGQAHGRPHGRPLGPNAEYFVFANVSCQIPWCSWHSQKAMFTEMYGDFILIHLLRAFHFEQLRCSEVSK